MGVIVVFVVFFVIPAMIICLIFQAGFKLWEWWRNRRETLFESRYQQHIQLSELEQRRRLEKRRNQQRRSQEKTQHIRRQELGRNLQMAFMQLPAAPDAQRLLSWTAQCRDLPQHFRRRQFERFRKVLAEQIERWVRDGVDRKQLTKQLRQIVRNLGVAKFEADYLIQAMAPTRSTPLPSPAEEFAGQLTEIQTDHQRRIRTIEAMENLDPDVKEELLEAEHQRYRGMLFGRHQNQIGK